MASHPHIEGCARLNVGRLNAFRLNFYEPLTFAIVGGTDRTRNVRIEGAAVEHVLNDQPDTAAVRVHGFVPVAGQTFALYAGERSADQQIFGGRLLATTVLYESRKENVAYDLNAIDPTWLLNRRKVLARYAGVGAVHLIGDLMSRFTYGFEWYAYVTIPNVVIDEITFTNETVASCLTAVCERIGASWYVDYANSLHVFFSEDPPAASITDATPRTATDLTLTEDLSQVVTRVVARGGAGAAAVDLPVGATEIPVRDDGWYSGTGGVAEVAAQRVTYMGVQGRSGTGALVGVGLAPTSPVHAAPMASNNFPTPMASGTYQYALTFANAVGETLPAPPASVTLGGTAPTLFKTQVRAGYYADWNGKTTGGNYSWRIALGYEGGGYALGPPTDYTVVNDREYEIYVGAAQTGANGLWYYSGLMSGTDARIDLTSLYRTVDGGNIWYREKFWSGVSAGNWLSTRNEMTDQDLLDEDAWNNGLFRYPGNDQIARFNGARIDGFATLPANFTARKLYRTTVGGSQLKLRAVDPLGDVFHDTEADAILGANAPTSDTSGAVAPSAQTVPAGATTIPVTDATPFAADGGASGGWASIGDLAIRYTGLSGATLTGVPAAGIGALTTAVRHGAQILVLARLVGVPASGPGALIQAIKAGDALTIRLELEDVVARTFMANRLDGNGVIEEVFSDSRMTLVELLPYAQALLSDRKDPRQTLRFVTRDESVQVGRLITVDLTTPPIHGTFRVQSISFDEIAISGGLSRVRPRRTVTASTKLYTFADLLRRLRGREGGAG